MMTLRTRDAGSGPALVAAASMQERFYHLGCDYAAGSPHIRHHSLRSGIVESLQDVVGTVLDARGSCRILEVGAGHGTFTDHLVAMGAEVVVTDMSASSAATLARRFRHNDRVRVVLDRDGSAASAGGDFDIVVCLSVLHHIPDYLAAVRGYLEQLVPGGIFMSFQDPLRYDRRSRTSLLVERSLYLGWRLTQGELRRGVVARIRRARGRHDETEVSDMVEYHVVRDGVDEQALYELLSTACREVELLTYWSAQAGWAQAAGRRLGLHTTFGLVARGRRPM